jgi:hypothetical protein
MQNVDEEKTEWMRKDRIGNYSAHGNYVEYYGRTAHHRISEEKISSSNM